MNRILLLILLLIASGYVSRPDLAQTDQDTKASDEKVYEGEDVDTKAKILSQPQAVFTSQAARQHVVGIVKLKAVFTGSGEVKDIEAINKLPAGLTDNAIAAARKITFTPAMKDGHPVSQRIFLEYTFELYDRIIHGRNFPNVFYDERCRDYTSIAPENMVFFTSEKEAKKAGYKKSKRCPDGRAIPQRTK